MKCSIIILLLLGVIGTVYAGSHSAAEIFNGAFFFVNASTIVNGTHVATRDETLGQLIGNIMYAPAFPGALYGNMSVAYGNDLPSTTNMSQALSLFSAYTGGYQVFPDATPFPYVEHYPIITNNPINGHTPKNQVAVRYYNTFDNDNLLQINSRLPPQTSLLYWRKNVPFPPAPVCSLTASVSLVGQGFIVNGVYRQQYSVTIKNNGERPVVGGQVILNLAPGQTISSAWNLNFQSGTSTSASYSLAFNSPLLVGQSVNSVHGFFVDGVGSVSAAINPANLVCP